MGRNIDQKTYQTFEEFEREELRRDGYFGSVDEILDEMFAGELDFELQAARGARARPGADADADADGDDNDGH